MDSKPSGALTSNPSTHTELVCLASGFHSNSQNKNFTPTGETAAKWAALLFRVADEMYAQENEIARLKGEVVRRMNERSSDETPAPRYGIPEALAYLSERADWLDREIRNGGNLEHLRTRYQECRYVASCIKDTSERINAEEKSSPLSDFIRNATAEEKERVYTKVIDKACEAQNAVLRDASEADAARKQLDSLVGGRVTEAEGPYPSTKKSEDEADIAEIDRVMAGGNAHFKSWDELQLETSGVDAVAPAVKESYRKWVREHCPENGTAGTP